MLCSFSFNILCRRTGKIYVLKHSHQIASKRINALARVRAPSNARARLAVFSALRNLPPKIRQLRVSRITSHRARNLGARTHRYRALDTHAIRRDTTHLYTSPLRRPRRPRRTTRSSRTRARGFKPCAPARALHNHRRRHPWTGIGACRT